MSRPLPWPRSIEPTRRRTPSSPWGIGEIARALDERGPTTRDELETLVGGRYWGPGRFRATLREAVFEGRVRRVSRNTYAPGG